MKARKPFATSHARRSARSRSRGESKHRARRRASGFSVVRGRRERTTGHGESRSATSALARIAAHQSRIRASIQIGLRIESKLGFSTTHRPGGAYWPPAAPGGIAARTWAERGRDPVRRSVLVAGKDGFLVTQPPPGWPGRVRVATKNPEKPHGHRSRIVLGRPRTVRCRDPRCFVCNAMVRRDELVGAALRLETGPTKSDSPMPGPSAATRANPRGGVPAICRCAGSFRSAGRRRQHRVRNAATKRRRNPRTASS